MFEVVPAKPEHVLAVDIQPSQASLKQYMCYDYARTLCYGTTQFAGIGDGKVVIIAGWQDVGGRAWLSTIIGGDAGPYMVPIVRKMRAMLGIMPFERIESHVNVNFEPANRLMRILGFQAESVMRKYNQDGDAFMYVRIK